MKKYLNILFLLVCTSLFAQERDVFSYLKVKSNLLKTLVVIPDFYKLTHVYLSEEVDFISSSNFTGKLGKTAPGSKVIRVSKSDASSVDQYHKVLNITDFEIHRTILEGNFSSTVGVIWRFGFKVNGEYIELVGDKELPFGEGMPEEKFFVEEFHNKLAEVILNGL